MSSSELAGHSNQMENSQEEYQGLDWQAVNLHYLRDYKYLQMDTRHQLVCLDTIVLLGCLVHVVH
jgi:hypothetical protein